MNKGSFVVFLFSIFTFSVLSAEIIITALATPTAQNRNSRKYSMTCTFISPSKVPANARNTGRKSWNFTRIFAYSNIVNDFTVNPDNLDYQYIGKGLACIVVGDFKTMFNRGGKYAIPV